MKSDNFVLLAIGAEKFGCRPSEMVCLRDSVLALDFDLAAAALLLDRERRAMGDEVTSPEGASATRHQDIYW